MKLTRHHNTSPLISLINLIVIGHAMSFVFNRQSQLVKNWTVFAYIQTTTMTFIACLTRLSVWLSVRSHISKTTRPNFT